MFRVAFELVVDTLHFVGLVLRSQSRLAAENLFLRKQLALYLERQAKPPRASNATRLTLVVLARFMGGVARSPHRCATRYAGSLAP